MDELLTDSEKSYFSIYQELFENPGWELLMKEFITPEIDRLPAETFGRAKNFPELAQARGKHQAYLEFAAIPEMIAQTKEAIIENALLEQQDERETSRPDQ